MYLSGEQTAAIKFSIIRGENPNFEKKDMVGTKIISRKEDNHQPKQQDQKVT